MDENERKKAGIKNLPDTLLDALDELEEDNLIIDAIGTHIIDKFTEAKRIEYTSYRQYVSKWELDNYFMNY